MISREEALKIAKKRYPKIEFVRGIDFGDLYVFEGSNNKSEIDYDEPFFGVSKKTGEIDLFSPSYDFENFLDSMVKATFKV